LFESTKAAFKSIDIFGQQINFTFDGGRPKYKTLSGAFTTFMLFVIVIFFATITLIRFTIQSEAMLSTHITKNYFNYANEFTSADGF